MCVGLICIPLSYSSYKKIKFFSLQGIFREFGGARCAHNIVRYPQCRQHALMIIQQLVLSPNGDDDMGTLLGLMHSAPPTELQLKTDILRVRVCITLLLLKYEVIFNWLKNITNYSCHFLKLHQNSNRRKDSVFNLASKALEIRLLPHWLPLLIPLPHSWHRNNNYFLESYFF